MIHQLHIQIRKKIALLRIYNFVHVLIVRFIQTKLIDFYPFLIVYY